MSEQSHAEGPDESTGESTGESTAESAAESTAESAGVTTGNENVDEVLASLDSLADLPVGEHVAVFEQAHDRLRGALDA